MVYAGNDHIRLFFHKIHAKLCAVRRRTAYRIGLNILKPVKHNLFCCKRKLAACKRMARAAALRIRGGYGKLMLFFKRHSKRAYSCGMHAIIIGKQYPHVIPTPPFAGFIYPYFLHILPEKQRFINKNTEMMKGLQLYDANARKKPVNFILRLKSAFLDLT